jgi:hypothetical protein
MNGMYFRSFVCTFLNVVPRLRHELGRVRRSSTVMACTFAPATTPLWAMGVALAMAFDQLLPGNPGMFDGYRNVTVGTFQEMSPMSYDPAPTLSSGFPGAFSSVSSPDRRRLRSRVHFAEPWPGPDRRTAVDPPVQKRTDTSDADSSH